MRDPITQPKPLVCSNCITVDRDGRAKGCRADLAGGHDDEDLELVILCPRCWTAEFGADES